MKSEEYLQGHDFQRYRLEWIAVLVYATQAEWLAHRKIQWKQALLWANLNNYIWLRPGQGFLGITGIPGIWSPFHTGICYFFGHNSGIKYLVFPWFWVFSSWTWIKRLFFSQSGSSCRVVFYNFEVFWYLMGKKSGILVSHCPTSRAWWLQIIEDVARERIPNIRGRWGEGGGEKARSLPVPHPLALSLVPHFPLVQYGDRITNYRPQAG